MRPLRLMMRSEAQARALKARKERKESVGTCGRKGEAVGRRAAAAAATREQRYRRPSAAVPVSDITSNSPRRSGRAQASPGSGNWRGRHAQLSPGSHSSPHAPPAMPTCFLELTHSSCWSADSHRSSPATILPSVRKEPELPLAGRAE